MNRLKNKVALITGAAMGIGQACAELFAREGARVVVADIDKEAGMRVATNISGAGSQSAFYDHEDWSGSSALFCELNVAREKDWKRALETTAKTFGALHILVNNAGVLLSKNIEETTLDEWRDLMSVNLDGVFLGIKHSLPLLRASGGGSIINLSSIAGLLGFP
ncbi:MAG TPA: SDR family NAD(P)-dependent oxidoreductase, partial [candidate division Zixibacteria bacterium]|nr:SDR family NAD(P)-dependent oxidoreductase [candidate division Zixibacteria bacterium]